MGCTPGARWCVFPRRGKEQGVDKIMHCRAIARHAGALPSICGANLVDR
jgi:hypothetical protein